MRKWHLFTRGVYVGTIRARLRDIAARVTIDRVWRHSRALDVRPLSAR
jgi:hypothetical protein